MPQDAKLLGFFRVATLERGLILGGAAFLCGVGLLVAAVWGWLQIGFGPLDYSQTMRWVIPGATLSALGFQTILFSFLISMMGINRN